MYRLMVNRGFIAQHFLTVPGCGPENVPHSHAFTLEVLLEGRTLNQYGYLVDIDAVKEAIEESVVYYQDRLLNDMPEFDGLNPSVEHFSAIICRRLMNTLNAPGLDSITVRLWEDEAAWASFTQPWS